MAKIPAIEQSYYYAVPVAKVFAALTKPAVLTQWFLAAAQIDPEKGGSFRFTWRGGYTMKGKVKTFEPPRKVAYQWLDRRGKGKVFETLVRFELRKKGKGTVLKLTHKGFRSSKEWIELYGRIQSGWAYFLVNLRSVLEHGTDLRLPGD